MLWYNFIAIFTLFTFCVGLELFLFSFLNLNIAIMTGNRLKINYNLFMWILSFFWKNKCFCVYIPPVSTFIFNKIADHLIKSGSWKISLDKFNNVSYILQSFVQMIRWCTFHSTVCGRMFGVYNKFTNLIYFSFWVVLIFRCQNPAFVAIVTSPAGSHYRSLNRWSLYKSLDNTWFASWT